MPDPESSAAPTAPAAVSPAESAPVASPIPEGFDLESAFSLRALSASPTAAAPAETAVEGEPAQPEAVASTPDDQDTEPAAESTTTSEPKLSRRQQAEQERQAEIAAARAEWEAERKRADDAERENAVLREAEQERVRAYVARMGDDKEFNRLNGLPSSSLSYEEQTTLDQWKLNRTDRDLLEQDAQFRALNGLAREFQQVSHELAGIDPEQVKKAGSAGALCRYVHEAATAAVRAELNDKIAALEADNRALRAQRVGQARQPEAGGASPPSTQVNPNTWPTHLTAEEDLAAAFSARPQRNGR